VISFFITLLVMLPVKQAESLILDLVQPLDPNKDVEIINLEAASGRILATTVTSKLDYPYWDNTAMDGYAVRYADVKHCHSNQPAVLEIIEEIPAGYKPQKLIEAGQAARIFTGAMMPEGADTIVIQENTQREGNKVRILSSPQPKEYVRYRGSFYQAGNPMLMPGIVIDAPEIAVLATAQCTQIPVYRRPRVAIFSTGDELIMPEQTLQSGQIIDSNQYALAALVAKDGGIPINMGIVPDRVEDLQKVISQAISSADMVFSTGGVSVGDYDYIPQIISELGGEIHIRSIAIKPGKPLTVARFPPACLYFGIPGNPVSALVSYWRFGRSALKKLCGQANNWKPIFIKARSRQELRSGGKLETYLWGKLYLVEGIYEFELAEGIQSSGNLINLAQTNGLAVVPAGQTKIHPQEDVIVIVNYPR
jgi:molybdopterin molybdotransferase